jgi:hypothetical protein
MSATSNPLFGRKFQLQIKSASGTVITIPDPASGPNDPSLRVTFDVQTRAWKDLWSAQIVIYNLNEQVSNFILGQGQNSSSQPAPSATGQAPPISQSMEVTLSAGYESPGKYGIIWDGYVLQPLFERENQVDFKVTLNCVLGLLSVGRNSYGNTISANTLSQMQIVQNMASGAYHPISLGTISPNLNKTLPRAKTVFGSPRKILDEIARDNNMQWWLGQRGLLNVGKVDEDLTASLAAATVYTPTTGIVGTPQQTQFGVNFRVLLDPTVIVKKPLMCVNIDNTQIRQALKQVGVLQGILSQDGTYVVIGARYLGDTRGQNWYTDITGSLLAQDKMAAIQAASAEVQQQTS